MLVLSRQVGESVRVTPRPTFAVELAKLLAAANLLNPAVDISTAAGLIEEVTDSPVFDLSFSVLDIRGRRVRVGCSADQCWHIRRAELPAEAVA